MNKAEKYIKDVQEKKILTCDLVKKTIKRHVEDIEHAEEKGLFFDKKAGEKAMRWFSFIKHSKGSQFAGKPFILSGWQAFIVWCLFGWKNLDGSRRFNYGYIEVARKNGKTTFVAALALFMLIADKEPSAEVYIAATKRDQAKICFDEAKNMVKISNKIKDHVTVYMNNIHNESLMSKMEPLSSDYDTLDGLNPYCSIVDEYHAHKTPHIYNVLKSAMGSRINPMQIIITTAGTNRESPCFKLRKNCINILSGIKQQDNFFAIIYTLDEKDKWSNSRNWIKSNPNLNVSISLKYLKDECQSAKNNPGEEVNFKTKNLNIWTDAPKVWIRDDDWLKCDKGLNIENLYGRKCWGGLDLASHLDINALALLFEKNDQGLHDLLMSFWMPDEKVKKENDYIDYFAYANQGYIKATEGNVIDISFISNDIINFSKEFQITSIGFDPALAHHGIIQKLMENELPMFQFPQNIISMSVPTKEFEKMIISEKINHGGNPILRWMNGNVVIYRDANDNIKVHKGRSSGRIDGIVAAIMAVGEMMRNNIEEESVYEKRGIISI